jgi:acetyl-CoA synthetase (ADP-forming)/acetyltransferase
MDLQRLFYPESVAVIGASPNLGGGKMPYYQILQWAGYKGRLYPVNPKYTSIDGAKVYASLDDIPEAVDLAIAGVPAGMALQTVQQAARKGIKYLHFFTSGFSEIGNIELERAMLAEAQKGPTRIIGPNCIGIHCTEGAITCDIPKTPFSGIGKVAFLGQSGGMTHNFMRMAHSRQLELNKVVSYGNQIDLKVEDYLEYLAEDDSVKVIAGYIEDIKDSRRFMEALNKTTRKKPVVILKGGITEQGAKAAASHTGAMAASHEIWQDPCRPAARLPRRGRRHIGPLHRLLLAGRSHTPRAFTGGAEAYQQPHQQCEHQHHQPGGPGFLRVRLHHHGAYHRGHGRR